MVSVINNAARVVYVYISLLQQHIKVRYTQLIDFDYYTDDLSDLFARWLLCEPVSTSLMRPGRKALKRRPPGKNEITPYQSFLKWLNSWGSRYKIEDTVVPHPSKHAAVMAKAVQITRRIFRAETARASTGSRSER
jgi:hypothetical protein